VIEGLDHIAIVVRDLEAAAAAYGRLLGRTPLWLGHGEGIREAWFQLPNTALNLVQREGPGVLGDPAAARLEAGGEGLWALGFAVADLEAERTLVTRRGVRAEPVRESSTTSGSGETRTWRSCDLNPSDTGGAQIRLVAGTAPRPISPPTAGEDAAVSELDHVVINTANCDRAVAVYGARIGLDLRLDRSNEAWGARQLFFRCGSAVVEFGASLKAPVSDAPDRFGGLAWRVRDADAAQARLAGEGFDVSEVRSGRKPGTRVFTLRSGAPSAPALIIQQNAEPAGAL